MQTALLSSTTSPTIRGLLGAATTSMVVLQAGRRLAGVMRSRRLAQAATVGASAYFLFQAFRTLQAVVGERAQAQRDDDALDSRIDGTFPASDATAIY